MNTVAKKQEKAKTGRRGFLARSIAMIGGLAVPVLGSAKTLDTALPLRGNDALFVAESGMLGYDDAFFLGGIYAAGNTEKYEAEIKALRQTYRYKSIISFKSNDRYKLEICKALLDWFFQQNELVFWAGRFSSEHRSGTLDSPSSWQVLLEKCDHYQTLMAGQPTSNKCEVRTKMTSAYGPSVHFFEAFEAKTGMTYQPVDTRDSQLVQLTDLLLGCVVSATHGRTINPTKKEIMAHLQQLLGAAIPTNNYTHPRFRVL